MSKTKITSPLPKGALKLLLSAEKLFGEQGIAAVSLRQVVSAAGQANSSAVQHHFGSKEGLLQAVFDMRLPELDEGRMQILETVKDQAGHIAISQLLKAMFLPVIESMDETVQQSFALFNSQLMQMEVSIHPFTHSKVPQPAYMEIQQRLQDELDYLPAAVFQLRLRLATDIFFGALNEWRRLSHFESNPYPSDKPYWREIFMAMELMFKLPYTV